MSSRPLRSDLKSEILAATFDVRVMLEGVAMILEVWVPSVQSRVEPVSGSSSTIGGGHSPSLILDRRFSSFKRVFKSLWKIKSQEFLVFYLSPD